MEGNHPFDVARVEGQARAISGEAQLSMVAVLRHVHAEYGMRGLFQGVHVKKEASISAMQPYRKRHPLRRRYHPSDGIWDQLLLPEVVLYGLRAA